MIPIGVSPAFANGEIGIVRREGFEAWSRFRAGVERTRASTDLIVEKTMAYEISREIDGIHLEALREQLSSTGERTLARACIYARSDEVLFQPDVDQC